jgi:hypothetical protein
VILYTCGLKEKQSSWHPCGRAASALDKAGYEYEIKDLPGYRLMPWTWGQRRRQRGKIREMTGQVNLPVLALDEGRTVVGSGKIVEWANAHPAYQPEVGGG